MRKIIVCVLAFMLSGCGITTPIKRSDKKLSFLNIGMTKQEVIKTIGEPDSIRSSEKKDNSIIETHDYFLYGKGSVGIDIVMGFVYLTIPWWLPLDFRASWYLLNYKDGKLEKWDLQKNRADVEVEITDKNKK